MGKTTGFLEFSRELPPRRPPSERTRDWLEIYGQHPEDKLRSQASRCMDCGIPFCHTGCALNNLIPDWNDLVYRGRWKEAVRQLHATNNFPEFTGRICPAPCEAACVLGVNQPAVTIKEIEKTIVERGFREGWILPQPARRKTGRSVAIVGSGPSGLAAAQQLARAGHDVTVYEKADRPGGLLRYGIPNFKLEKHLVDRRLDQITAEGVRFITGCHIGRDVPAEKLRREYDALLLCGGAEMPRDLRVPGRELDGIHFAMEFLPQQNRRCEAESAMYPEILATGKRVVIIGGGDTGADCLGTVHRQGARSVEQWELLPMPPQERSPRTPWPLWPMQLRTEAAHEEGGIRKWGVATTHFTSDEHNRVRALNAIQVGPPPDFQPLPGTEVSIEAELVLLALGFIGPVRNGLLEELGVQFDDRGNVATDVSGMTSIAGVFAAGDMRRGQSLVMWAIAEGRKVAASIDRYLQQSALEPGPRL